MTAIAAYLMKAKGAYRVPSVKACHWSGGNNSFPGEDEIKRILPV
jgi:hypothetical protein